SSGIPQVRVTSSFATYRIGKRDDVDIWVRQPHRIEIPVLDLPPGPTRKIVLAEYGAGLPNVSLSVRCINAGGSVLVTLSLVNSIVPEQDRNEIEAASLFQTALRVDPCDGTLLVPKPPRRAASRHQGRDDGTAAVSDEESGALL